MQQNPTSLINLKKSDTIEFSLKNRVFGYNKPTMTAQVEILNSDKSCWVVTIAGWLKIMPEDIVSVTSN